MQEIVNKFTKNIPGHAKPDASHVLGFETAQAGIYPKHPKETMPLIFLVTQQGIHSNRNCNFWVSNLAEIYFLS